MPAKVVVVAGAQPGQEIWIEDEVTRLGSDPACEISMAQPGLPPHAATLEYRDGGYTVYSRSEQPIVLDRQALEYRAAGRWQPGRELRLTDALVLRLVIEGSPEPARRAAPAFVARPEDRADDGADDEPVPAAPPKPNTGMQLAIGGGVLLLLAIVLFVEPSSGPEPQPVNTPKEFYTLVKDLQSDAGKGNPDAAQLANTLQQARLASLRGERREANATYARLRDRLLRAKTASGKLPEVQDKLLEFVLSQLVPPPATSTDGGF